MAETETLDTLLGPGPAAVGNPGAEAGGTGPAPDATSQGTPAGGLDMEQRIAELEELNRRNTERLTGAEQSAMQWKTRAEESESVVKTLATKLEEIAQSGGQSPSNTNDIPGWFVTEVNDVAGYNLDQNEIARRWQSFKSNMQPSAQTQPQSNADYLTRQDLEAFATRQTEQQQAVNAVLGQHPELSDNGFLTQVIQEYDTLRQDPTTAMLYPEAQDGPQVVAFNGRRFDLRLIDKAANNFKAKAASANAGQNGPTLEGGSTVSRSGKSTSPMIPKAFVGDNGVFNDPTVMRVLTAAGWGGNTRQHVEKMLKHLPESQRSEWEQQR